MTLEEKAVILSGSNFWETKDVARLGIEKVMVTDGRRCKTIIKRADGGTWIAENEMYIFFFQTLDHNFSTAGQMKYLLSFHPVFQYRKERHRQKRYLSVN